MKKRWWNFFGLILGVTCTSAAVAEEEMKQLLDRSLAALSIQTDAQ